MRRKTTTVKVGHVFVGGMTPIVIQSMTNTDTADVNTTVNQIIRLSEASSELVRVTVNNDESAKAIPSIIDELDKQQINTPNYR